MAQTQSDLDAMEWVIDEQFEHVDAKKRSVQTGALLAELDTLAAEIGVAMWRNCGRCCTRRAPRAMIVADAKAVSGRTRSNQ